ncbi:MAG: hypothetical protein CM1200mP18_08940 [Gammaproteobacteria bacterium]|nr:MAG: hypothetical protein CM1200mP18_08940 [Gammaproteobacteria bacterium]
MVSQDTAAYGADVKYPTELTRGAPLRSHITDLTRALGELGSGYDFTMCILIPISTN